MVCSVSPAVDLMELNCLVLGDDPSRIFGVQIASTASVYSLKKAIKELKSYEFNNINACCLELWRVSDLMPTVGC